MRLVSDKAEVLGASFDIGERGVIGIGNRTPFYVKKDAFLDIGHSLG